MRPFTASSLTLSLIKLASALEITSPTADTILTPYSFTVTWQRNSTIDPAHINIDLTNVDESGFGSRTIGTNVTVNDYSYTILSSAFNALSSITNGTGWQLNINSVAEEGSSFVTQSEVFTIHDAEEAGVGSDSASGSSSSTSSSAYSASSASSASSSASASSASGSSASALASGTTSSASRSSSGSTSASTTSAGTASEAATSTSSGLAAFATGNMNFAAGGLVGAAAMALLV